MQAEAPAPVVTDDATVFDKIVDFAQAWAPNLIGAALTLIIGYIVAKIIRGIIRKVMNGRNLDKTLTGFVTSLLYMMLMTLVIISALGKLGVATGSFVAIIGAAGLAVGFALQGSLSNFAAGVMLIIFRPFKAGDVIDAGGVVGKVEEVAMFATTMLSPDNKKIIVPNSNITAGNITNFSAMGTRRVDMVFGIGYDDDIKKAKDLLAKIIGDDERVLADPAPVIALGELADSSVNFVVRPWCNGSDYWGLLWDTQEKVKIEFDKAGISIPYPQQDVHMHQVA